MSVFQLDGIWAFICLVAIASILIILWAIYVVVKVPRVQDRRSKLTAIVAWNLFLFTLTIFTALLHVPSEWACEQSLQAANDFLRHLNESDYQSAQELIIDNMMIEGYRQIEPNLENPANRPISWELEITGYHPPEYIATGVVTLPENQEVPVSMYMNWGWKTASWKISGVLYDPYKGASNENEIRFLMTNSDVGIVVFKVIPFLASVISIYISIKYLLLVSRQKTIT